MTFLEPLTLTGRNVILEPLAPEHHDGLVDAARDGELWKLWYTSVPAPEGMANEIRRRLDLQEQGSAERPQRWTDKQIAAEPGHVAGRRPP